MSECPVCPNCARKMTPVSEPEFPHAQRQAFRCENCGSAFTELPDGEFLSGDRALVLNFGAGTVPH